VSASEQAFPLNSFRDAAAELRRPFETLALKWKVQNASGPKENPTGGVVVCYMDRGLVIDRLNIVIPHLWQPEFTELEKGHMLCRLTIHGDPLVVREDVGEGGTFKARYSDALKRVAVQVGVGVSLSRVPKSKLAVESKRVRVWKGHDGKAHVEITQPGLDYLRARYDEWLKNVGITAFGEPLLHGDLGDAQGDDEVSDESIIDDSSAVDLYTSLSEAGLTLRQQVGLVNAVGAHITSNAGAADLAKACASLTEEQAAELDMLIAERMGGERRG
jgi:hypothetical protein